MRSCSQDNVPNDMTEVVLNVMEMDYGYPSSWLANRVTKVFTLKNSSGDVVYENIVALTLNSEASEPFFVFLLEHSGQKAKEESLRAIMTTCPWIGMGAYVNGADGEVGILRQNLYSLKLDHIPDIEHFSYRPSVKPLVNKLATNTDTRSLEPLDENIENVFFEIHSHLRDIDGLHPDEALDELCKLIYAKLYDEETTPKGSPMIFQRWIYSCSEDLAHSIRMLYRKACEYDLRVFRLKIPQYERSRGVFNTQMRLSSTAINRSVDVLERYALSLSRSDVKGRAFQNVLDKTVRNGMGQFFTPEPVVGLMVDVACPQVSDLILDPFCGSGHFLSRSLEVVRTSLSSCDDKQFHEFAFGKLHGIEKSDRMVRVAMTDMRLHGDGHSNIRCTDALADFANFPDIAPESFDTILTNPPFGSLLGAETVKKLGGFDLADGRKNVPLEILGIERCIQFLRPGGRLGIVLPDSILSNKNTAYVREWISVNSKLRAIISLPIEAFSPFGANVKTSILFARKWKPGENRLNDYKIFLGRIDNLGYDASGKFLEEQDVDAIKNELLNFLKVNGW